MGLRWPSKTFARYLMFEFPSMAMSAALLYLLVDRYDLDPRIALGLWALWVAKDFALYPWLRHAYEVGDPDATASMLGTHAIAHEGLDPNVVGGYVRLGSELWRAELAPGCSAVKRGGVVRVEQVRGLTLVVSPDPSELVTDGHGAGTRQAF